MEIGTSSTFKRMEATSFKWCFFFNGRDHSC